jgi:hypothetical protein
VFSLFSQFSFRSVLTVTVFSEAEIRSSRHADFQSLKTQVAENALQAVVSLSGLDRRRTGL